MKIYFEDGQLRRPDSLPFKYDHAIDAGEGYSYGESALRWIRENNPESVVYTNLVTAISNFYAWNETLRAPEIYMRRGDTNEFVRIDALTDRELRAPHNLMHLYMSNAFGNIDPALY